LNFKANIVLHFLISLMLLLRIKDWVNLLLQTVVLDFYL